MKTNLFKRVLWLVIPLLTVFSINVWGATGDEVTAVGSIVSGKAYYIKGVRSSTTYYLTFTDAVGAQSGTESSTTAGAVPITFTSTTGGWHLTTPSGKYIAPGTSNGTITVSTSEIVVSGTNQSSKIRLSITSSGTDWSIQKNTSAANFGGYKNTQTDITLIEAAPKSTVTFYNAYGSSSHSAVTQSAIGASVTLPAASPSASCTILGWKFAGWKDGSYQTSDVTSISGLIPAGSYTPTTNKNLYAVYKITEGATGAPVGDPVFTEDFSGFVKDNVPTSSNDNTFVYGGSTLTYTCINGSGTTKIYEESTAGGASPEILIGKNNGSLTIAGIPSGKAKTLTLTYKKNNKSLSVSVSGTGYSIGAISGSNPYTATITVGSAETFNLTFTATNKDDNVRLDDISIVVATTDNGGTTTYNSNPNCTYDSFVDNMHGNETIIKQGSYSMPAALSDATPGDDYCAEKHYHFVGWVSEAYVNADGTLKDGYASYLYEPGNSGHTANNTTYYAIWVTD